MVYCIALSTLFFIPGAGAILLGTTEVRSSSTVLGACAYMMPLALS
jgi:hypothetical protein